MGTCDLARGSAWVTRYLGVSGGPVVHEPALGTVEQRFAIGDGFTLSLLAADPNTTASAHRGIFHTSGIEERIAKRPTLVGWMVATDSAASFDALIKRVDGLLGDVVTLHDGRRLTVPEDGYPLEGGLIPQVLSAPESTLPSACRFTWMEAAHPHPAKVQYLLGELGVAEHLVLTSAPAYSGMTMCAYCATPSGNKTLMS
jgi:hypothetical protein